MKASNDAIPKACVQVIHILADSDVSGARIAEATYTQTWMLIPLLRSVAMVIDHDMDNLENCT